MIPHLQASRQAGPRQRRDPLPAGTIPSGTVIPYDYAAVFKLTGRRGNALQDAISISPDGVFVAVGISYGLDQQRASALPLYDTDPQNQRGPFTPGSITLGDIPIGALLDGIRVNPRLHSIMFTEQQGRRGGSEEFSNELVTVQVANQVIEQVSRPRDIVFRFSMVDTSTGREMQDEPQFSLSSLGRSDGQRPFRPLAQPISFLPRSTVRVQIEEQSTGVEGTLFIVLYGYKVLVGPTCPQPNTRAFTALTNRHVINAVHPGQPVIPFDYVTKFELTGRPGNLLEDEVTINAEGGYVATAIGYGLAVEDEPVELFIDTSSASPQVDLNNLPLEALSPNAVSEGFRIRPDYIRLIVGLGGTLQPVPLQVAEHAFERLNRPEDVSFRYSIYDSGIGRDWQNRPLHNIGGLGIADGQRPFKRLAQPRTFEPRSTVRVVIEEGFGRGTLFVVFHGYKIPAHAEGKRPL